MSAPQSLKTWPGLFAALRQTLASLWSETSGAFERRTLPLTREKVEKFIASSAQNAAPQPVTAHERMLVVSRAPFRAVEHRALALLIVCQ